MKLSSLVLLPAMVLAAVAIAGGATDPIELQYDFEAPRIQTVILDGEQYDRVVMPETPNSGDIGYPALPARGATILIPFGSDVAAVEVLSGEKVLIGEELNIEPMGTPAPLSADPSTIPPVTADRAIYKLNSLYPADLSETVGVQVFRGYRMLILKLHPVQYLPARGELYYYPRLTVRVTLDDLDGQELSFRGFDEDEQAVGAKVDNPADIPSYWAADKRGTKSYDLLILTTPSLASAFQPLKDYHDSTGIPTEILTTSDVGSSNTEDIRAWLMDRFTDDGVSYLLIGGDDDVIPAKDLFVRSWDGAGAYVEYAMPSDIYYACLDGNYNSDGDPYWGEPTDGRAMTDVDLVAELYVGRAAVGDAAEVARFIAKTIQYLESDVPYLHNALFVGEHLGFGGVSEYAANSLEQLIDGSVESGYTTTGVSSTQYLIDELYDRDWVNNSWPRSELTARINEGVHLLNHFGHGSSGYAMKYNSSQAVAEMLNEQLFFVYSQACLSGHFDDMDCFAENIHIKTDFGAFAVIMNARYGWGSSNSIDGPSERFHREYWDAVFGEGMPQMGAANHDSKEDNLYRINESCMRWCTYELTLFGDPTIPFKGAQDCAVSKLADSDGDNVCDVFDNCPTTPNPDQADSDGDHAGDVCDPCPNDADDDSDSDGYCANVDNCPDLYNPDQADSDDDSVGDLCDICAGHDDLVDADADGVPDGCDVCAGHDDLVDADGDGVPDGCDQCAGYDDNADTDFDGVADSCDNCPEVANPDQYNTDGEGEGDACCCKIRGDILDIGQGPNISQLVSLVTYMFQDGLQPSCPAACDVNDSGGPVDVADLVYLAQYMFQDGPDLVPCE